MLIIIGCTNSIECDQVNSVENQKSEIDSLLTTIEPLINKLNKKEIHEYNYEVYRVWYFHSLTKEKYMIEFENVREEAIIRFEVFSSDSGSESINVMERWDNTLTKKGWEHIKYLIDRYNFWNSEIVIEREVADGFVYLLEGNKSGCNTWISKIVSRVSPNDKDEIGWLCEDLFILGERFKE